MVNLKTITVVVVVVGIALCSIGCSNDDTSSTPPVANNVEIQIGATKATGSYTYFDQESNAEGNSSFTWYRADDINGTKQTIIENATERAYTYTLFDHGKYLAFEVTPTQTDNTAGAPIKSSFKGSITAGALSKDNITLYTVSGATITKKIDFNVVEDLTSLQENTQKHQELWEQVLKVVPESYRAKINEFMIFAGDFDTTSELNGTLGYVFPTKEDLSTWQFGLAIDIAYLNSFDDQESGVNGTIIHEFGHILTLNNDQVNATINSTNCTTYHIDEGCSKNNSYLYEFHTNHWASIATDNTAQQNYSTNPNSYVSEYAATNIAEDMAETFRFYVLSSIPTDNTFIKNKKIIELDGHQPLQNLRTAIREDIGNPSLLARKSKPSRLGNFRGCGTHRMMNKLKKQK